MDRIGKHILSDLYGINSKTLEDDKNLMFLFERTLNKYQFNIVGRLCHKFVGGGNGVTGIFLLSESHASFHTYPEVDFIALDLFSCGSTDPELVLNELIEELQPSKVWKAITERGKDTSHHPRLPIFRGRSF
ncbi:adenosylmethionine decarboxylase [Trichocoleus sp. DQ-A3]|uniref:adenosylmethionine decarboxylase n=1 Tax=Cyanophyceae TaxID=3028117 RepID=UPI001686A4F2|nr:adenosylmethionine decarboxylase [Coleofasciculus sp. FACHB-125]MBD1903675.1 adenosylmethionine decarboxylase [Coleofasciculus sp. FACHB-125]